MATKKKQKNQTIVIFGASGDLCWRKLIPALYNMNLCGYLPPDFKIVCIDYKVMEVTEYKEYLLGGVNTFSRTGKVEDATWTQFSDHIHYLQGNFLEEGLYNDLNHILNNYDKETGGRGNRLFYYSVSPRFIEPISDNLYKHKVAPNKTTDRIIIEKPFGTDLATAKKLNVFLTKRFDEEQIYRIDHYLGKETVQNIMAFRFANYIFEPLWTAKYVDHVQITVAETVSVGSRAGYYEPAGAIRDMIQNHLLQLLCVVAMEPPCSLEPEEIRNKKIEVLKKITPFTEDSVETNVVRGQYTEGKVKDLPQVAYRSEINVAPKSVTETYFAAKFTIDQPRWKGVPFYIRTGKSLHKQTSVITIQFKDTPHKIFKNDVMPNKLVISIQPDNEISLFFESKKPGLQMELKEVEMDFTYRESYSEQLPEAYEALILDAIEGDATLFMRADQVEAAWKVVMPIINTWQNEKKPAVQFYEAGSWGPKAADKLLKKDGRVWF